MIWKTLLVLACYFVGNISPSTIIARSRGIDIKKEGSGNAGTTNALRVLGKKAAIITLVVDLLKGVVCTLAGVLIFDMQVGCMCAGAVFLGHIYPALLRFRGGKGAATAVGAMLVLDWRIALIVLAIAAIFLLISKRMSVGTLVAAISFPFITWAMNEEILPFAVFVTAMVLVTHRANIVRLSKGQEPKMSIFDKEKERKNKKEQNVHK